MAGVDDRALGVARVYAQSMLALAEESGQSDAVVAELEALAEMLDRESELEAFFSNPRLDQGRRAEALEKVFRGRTSDLLVDSLQVMNRKGRLALVPTVAVALRQEWEALRGIIEVQVTTAIGLDEATQAALREAVRKVTDHQPRLELTVDPSILAGLRVRIGDRVFDRTARGEIEKARRLLIDRAAAELASNTNYWEAPGEA